MSSDRWVSPDGMISMPADQTHVRLAPWAIELVRGLRYDRSLQALLDYERPRWLRWTPDKVTLEGFRIGQIVRCHRVFGWGDVVFVPSGSMGGWRCPVFGWSSKKRAAINRFYVQYVRFTPGDPNWSERVARHHVWQFEEKKMVHHFDRVPVRLLESPGELAQQPLADPAVRAFALEALQAASAASPVGLGSRGSSSGGLQP